MLRLDLPIPPTNNHYKQYYCAQSSRAEPHTIRARLTPAAQAYKDEVGYRTNQLIDKPLDVPVRVLIRAYLTSDRRYRADLDNIPKVVFDALNGIAWTDDRLVSEYTVINMPGNHSRLRLEVEIEPWAP